MAIKVNFSDIANLVTKGDNKIDEADAVKAKELGLAFVIAGMSEEDFNKAANANPNACQAYLNNGGLMGAARRYKRVVCETVQQWIENLSDNNVQTIHLKSSAKQEPTSKDIEQAIKVLEPYGYNPNDKTTLETAYREAVKKWHPDKNDSPDAESKMAEINAAHDLLTEQVG